MSKVCVGIFLILVAAGMSTAQKGPKSAPLADNRKQDRALTLTTGTSISGELQNTLDVRKARVGDQVMLRTTQAVRQDGEVVIPRGSTLIGRVTEVQQGTKDNARSRLGILFETVRGNGISRPITASVYSITSASAGVQSDDLLMTDTGMSQRTTGSASRSSSGGLLGGAAGTVGGLVGTTTQTLGSVATGAGATVRNSAGSVGNTIGGIQIAAEGQGSAATTLSSPNRNFRIEKGATFHLRVATAGQERE